MCRDVSIRETEQVDRHRHQVSLTPSASSLFTDASLFSPELSETFLLRHS